MKTTTFNLTARRHDSRVLGSWLATREGGVERAGLQAAVAGGGNGSTTGITPERLAELLGAMRESEAGQAVTRETALRVATVYACVGLVAGAIGSLPLHVYRRDGGASRQSDHDYTVLFNEQPCEEWNAIDAWTYLLSCKFFEGDGYAELLRPSFYSNRIIGWKPHHSTRVTPFREDGRKLYRVVDEDGRVRVLHSADMIQLTSLGYDGLTSPSPITYAAREAVGIALAGLSYIAKFFSRGATFDYALKTSGTLKQDALDALQASLVAKFAGSRSPLILSGGLEPAQLSINPKDAEVLATRAFTVEEICRIFGVPSWMVNHTEKTTSWGSGVEQQGTAFVRYSLQRHLTQIAQEFNRKLWPGRRDYFVEHLVAALERADLKTRFEAFRIAIGRAGEPGWMVPNEARRLENMPPIEGGDTLNTGARDASKSTASAAG